MTVSKFRLVLRWAALLVPVLAICSTYASNENQDLVEVISTHTKATPLEHDPPVYPRRALRAETEGWVVLNFVIREDGTTDDIIVTHSSIENYFEKAAIKAVSAWTYEPATRNAKPVIEYNNQVRISFKIKGISGVTKSFQANYISATEAMEEGNLEKAKKLINRLESREKRLLSEVCFLDILNASYFSKTGNGKATLKHLERALVIAEDVTTNSMHIALLRQVLVEHAKAGNYRSAMRIFEQLQEVDTEMAANDPVYGLADRIKRTVEGDDVISTEGKISGCHHCGSRGAFWSYALNRNRFTIDQVDGDVSEVEILCGNDSISLVYKPDVVWDVKKEWGECHLMVSGEVDTSFRLTELPRVN